MKPFADNLRTWMPGLLTALIGVAGVRLLAPMLTGRLQAAVVIFGYLLVPVGLALIARQIRRKALANQEAWGDRP
jgi:hypothetical protein